jgi:putative oxidoreductase
MRTIQAIEEALARHQGWGVTLLRVVVGAVFLAHGSQKLFVFGIGGFAGYLDKLGVPAPLPMSAVVSLVEFGGGLALLLGLFTRWATIPLAANMLVAILTVHLPKGFFLPGGVEFTLTLLAAILALLFLGGGAASLDGLLCARDKVENR